jgi:uncharacterized membrane protein YtjA (UPF0391 family)
MLRYAVIFFVAALVAAFFGFGNLASGAASIGKLFFIGFIVLAVISGVGYLLRGGDRGRLP